MRSAIVVGMQWGDEGKGKVIDLLSEQADLIVRSQGGNNAGHTIVVGQEEYKFHLIPSGILYPHTRCCVGGGVVVDPQSFLGEIDGLLARGINMKGRLFLSPYAHVIFPYHRLLDKLYEELKGEGAIGTTGRGIGPCYVDKVSRIGIRVCELLDRSILEKRLRAVVPLKNLEIQKIFNGSPIDLNSLIEEYTAYGQRLLPYVADVEELAAQALEQKKNVLFEGAQGTLLDINYGTYPFVTSSGTLSAGIAMGAGIGPSRIDHVIGVVKAYTTRVGAGPLPTTLDERDQQLFMSHVEAREIGTTTGRRRRMGWFDVPFVRFAARLNGADSLAIMKLDILDSLDVIKICTAYRLRGKLLTTPPPIIEELEQVEPVYEELPGWKTSTQTISSFEKLPINAQRYVRRIQELVGVPIAMLSLGPERHRTIFLHNFFSK